MPPLLVLLFSSQFGGNILPSLTRESHADSFFPGMMGYLILMLMTPAYNCFAYESKGIRNYYTAPIRFRDVLLAKNLIYAAILIFEIGLSIALLSIRIGLPSSPVLAATILALVFAVAGQFAIADWVSLSFPRKLEYGSMRGQRGSGVSIWIAFGVQILLAGICSVILFTGRWTGNPWLPSEAFAALAAASLGGYFAGARCAQRCGGKEERSPDRNSFEIILSLQPHGLDVPVCDSTPTEEHLLRPFAACAQLFTVSRISRNSQYRFAEFRWMFAIHQQNSCLRDRRRGFAASIRNHRFAARNSRDRAASARVEIGPRTNSVASEFRIAAATLSAGNSPSKRNVTDTSFNLSRNSVSRSAAPRPNACNSNFAPRSAANRSALAISEHSSLPAAPPVIP